MYISHDKLIILKKARTKIILKTAPEGLQICAHNRHNDEDVEV